jgi:hypothetical protein
LVKNSTGINPLQDKSESGYIYPNPFDEDATFCFSTGKSQQVELKLFNFNGQLLNQRKLILSPGNQRFDLKFPIEGIYYLSVTRSDGPANFKVVYTGRKIQNSSIVYAGNEKLKSKNSEGNK